MTPRTTREDWPSGGRFRSVRVVPKQESQNERIETGVQHLQHHVFPLTTESRFYLEAKSRQFPDVYACNRSGHKVSHETVSEQMRQGKRANHRMTVPGQVRREQIDWCTTRVASMQQFFMDNIDYPSKPGLQSGTRGGAEWPWPEM
jgi:hypothetical protein